MLTGKTGKPETSFGVGRAATPNLLTQMLRKTLPSGLPPTSLW